MRRGTNGRGPVMQPVLKTLNCGLGCMNFLKQRFWPATPKRTTFVVTYIILGRTKLWNPILRWKKNNKAWCQL